MEFFVRYREAVRLIQCWHIVRAPFRYEPPWTNAVVCIYFEIYFVVGIGAVFGCLKGLVYLYNVCMKGL